LHSERRLNSDLHNYGLTSAGAVQLVRLVLAVHGSVAALVASHAHLLLLAEESTVVALRAVALVLSVRAVLEAVAALGAREADLCAVRASELALRHASCVAVAVPLIRAVVAVVLPVADLKSHEL
jgi:hypothetical protein